MVAETTVIIPNHVFPMPGDVQLTSMGTGENRHKPGEGYEGNTDVETEIQATFEMGQAMGVNLRNKEAMVRAAIQGEESQIGYQ
ncbi:hypothetical protein L1987_53835 [Smallanthus sonchifolius]|uniref:Uncharacterized protein n=1 Tax=Smallanthus sonchifolius TaxID=185202 RepID=A0ACB9EXM3_9ASTR|nr:hypothetical protein L1987_53835 [Smallanthus sonchifolius]